MNNNFLILLRSIASGDEFIFETLEGNYIAGQMEGTSLIPEGAEKKTVLSRLQLELYGEFPLGEGNKTDFKKVLKAFNLDFVHTAIQEYMK